MKVTLIAPPWIFKEEVEFVSQNIGLGYLASYLEMHDNEVVIIDSVAEGLDIRKPLYTKYADVMRCGLSDEDIIKRIPKDSELIGINAPFTDSRFIVNPLSHAIKKAFPDSLVVMGGIYPSTLTEESARLSGADAVISGEGEIPLLEITKGKDLKTIKGVSFYNSDYKFVDNGKAEMIENIEEEIPMPSFDLRPMKKYINWSQRGNKLNRTLTVVSSRGCPFKCRFCSYYSISTGWRAFSARRICEEIQIAIDKFGIDHVEFEDDNLTFNKERSMNIFDGIQNLKGKEGEKIIWSAPNGVMIHTLDKELISKMKESGCELIYLPVESGDPKILKRMRKGHWKTHLDKTLEVAGYCAEVGLEACAFFMLGYPGEDRKSFETTLDFCRRLIDAGATAITPLVATPYQNTELHLEAKENGWLVHEDMGNVLIYQQYSHFLPEFVLLNTPECSQQEAYERHQEMTEAFKTKHNLRREKAPI